MKRLVCRLFAVFFICLAALPGCDDTTAVPGRYVAESTGEQGQRIDLELEPDGQGSWTSEDDRIDFKWESQAAGILLHTKAGGIIEGNLSEGVIEFTIPGTGRVTFTKAGIR
ncbi:MAG: hypothetical protein ABSF90_26400 [Syntrophobacteraceae bacterium]|jgi:hypothetical protein